MPTSDVFHTVQQLAEQYDVNVWVVRDLAERLGLSRKIGRTRAVAEADLPTLEIGLRVRGYLKGYKPPVEASSAVEETVADR